LDAEDQWNHPLGWGGWLTPWKYPMCHFAKCGPSRSNGTSVITEIHWESLTPRVPPPRSLEVIRTDMDRSIDQ